jgi:hypothetical protein
MSFAGLAPAGSVDLHNDWSAQGRADSLLRWLAKYLQNATSRQAA